MWASSGTAWEKKWSCLSCLHEYLTVPPNEWRPACPWPPSTSMTGMESSKHSSCSCRAILHNVSCVLNYFLVYLSVPVLSHVLVVSKNWQMWNCCSAAWVKQRGKLCPPNQVCTAIFATPLAHQKAAIFFFWPAVKKKSDVSAVVSLTHWHYPHDLVVAFLSIYIKPSRPLSN